MSTFEYVCPKCNEHCLAQRHDKEYHLHKLVIVMGTGRFMVYKGDMNREYVMCPKCGMVEHQFSAEARDQEEDFKHNNL